jgi:hypothetical protein
MNLIRSQESTLPEYDVLVALLARKRPRDFRINSRESTPEVLAGTPHGKLQHWKQLAFHNLNLLRTVDKTCDHRQSISDPQYWETEARHYLEEYWKTLQSKQISRSLHRAPGTQWQSGIKKSTYAADGPISSRLRSSHAKEVRPPRLKKQSTGMVGRSCGKRCKGKISIPRTD